MANGLQVVVLSDHRMPEVTQIIYYKVGSADEPPGKSGLAHFLEHLMFKGTEKHPAGEISNAVFHCGGEVNAYTSYDWTSYHLRVPKAQFPAMMEFEADRMTGLKLTDENVLPERDVVLEEEGGYSRTLLVQILAALYLNHPYGRLPIGWRHEIEKLNRDDVLGFYRRFYAPNNAVLVIAGDVEAADVKSLVERNFGSIPAQPAISAQRMRPQEPEPAGPRTATLSNENVEITLMQRAYLVPSATTAGPGESAVLEVLAQLLDNHLRRALVRGLPLAVTASASYTGTYLDPTQFFISIAPRPGVAFWQVEQAIDNVIASIVKAPGPAEDLDGVKTQLITEAIYTQDDQEAMAVRYGEALSSGLSIDDVRNWPDRIRAVTPDQVRIAAQRWLDKKRSVTGYSTKNTATVTNAYKDENKREEKRS